METFILAVALFALAACGLGLGLFFGREPIKGSCGGLACVDGAECACGKGRKR